MKVLGMLFMMLGSIGWGCMAYKIIQSGTLYPKLRWGVGVGIFAFASMLIQLFVREVFEVKIPEWLWSAEVLVYSWLGIGAGAYCMGFIKNGQND